jgi:hypothetical protein
MIRFATVLAALFLLIPSAPARAETSQCTEIKSLPATITVQGVYCLKQDLSTAISAGGAISISTNNVTLDCNHWKIGGLAAGPGSTASGILAYNRKNIAIRNCGIRGFYRGIDLWGNDSAYNLAENNRIDLARYAAIEIWGVGVSIRGNRIYDVASAGLAVGIHLQSASGTVIDNDIHGVVATAGPAHAIRSLEPAGTLFVSANRVSGLASDHADMAAFRIAGPSVITGNALYHTSGTLSTHRGIFCGFGGVARDNVLIGFPVSNATYGCASVDNTVY